MPTMQFRSQTILIPPGKPQLVEIGPAGAIVVIQTPHADAIEITRHWNESTSMSEVCQCDSPCRTARTDVFVSALVWVSESTWEQRLLVLSEMAVRQINRITQMRPEIPCWRGLGLRLCRHGDRHNGRVTVEYRHYNNGVPAGFAVGMAVEAVTGISVMFFGTPMQEPSVPNTDQVVTPARARADKPRVSKGCGNCHKPKDVLE